jgi:hypothetical protein
LSNPYRTRLPTEKHPTVYVPGALCCLTIFFENLE